MMISNERPIILGEKPKIAVKMARINDIYTLSSLSWRVEFCASKGTLIMDKTEAEQVDEDTYTLRVDTAQIGTGKLTGVLYPCIPDSEVEGGYYCPPVPFDTGKTIVSPYYLSDGLHSL